MYESPIDIIYGAIEMKMENDILKAVQKVGVNVTKDSLISALMYDRHQYEKGYADAKAEQSWIPVNQGLPKLRGDYLVTFDDGSVQCNWFSAANNEFNILHESVIAWMNKPEGYKGEKT